MITRERAAYILCRSTTGSTDSRKIRGRIDTGLAYYDRILSQLNGDCRAGFKQENSPRWKICRLKQHFADHIADTLRSSCDIWRYLGIIYVALLILVIGIVKIRGRIKINQRLSEFNVICQSDHRYSVVITRATYQSTDGISEFKSIRRRTAAGYSGRTVRYSGI